MSVPRLNSEIVVDGQINEDEWSDAESIYLDNVTEPYENLPSPVKTRVRYFEDGDTLYLSFVANDPTPSQIRSFYHERDNAWRDDLVGVRLDPYGDHRLVFQFFVNPYGVQNDSTEDVIALTTRDSWDGIWESAGTITDSGYQVEIAIPLRNFNFNSEQQSQNWAIEFVRFYPRNEQFRISHIQVDRDNDCLACQMPYVSGFGRIKEGKSLSLTPTLVVDHSEKRRLETNSNWEADNNYEVGLDIKWGISSDVFLNATINPDFSQIEADAAQINLNNNFTLTLEEKRPFFLENQDIFSSNYPLVYTRNITAPNIGLKLTGRTGKHAYGIFMTDDETTTMFIPGNLGASIAHFEQSSNNAAIRYRFDANKRFNVGFLGTLRTSDQYHNYLGSTDFRYKITDQDILRAQFIYTDTQYPDFLQDDFCRGDDCEDEDIECSFGSCPVTEAYLRTDSNDNISGHALRINFNHEQREYFYNFRYQEINSGFRSDLGNQTRVDQNRLLFAAGKYFYGESGDWWNKIILYGNWDILRNDDRDVIENEWEYIFEIHAAMQSQIIFTYYNKDEIGDRFDESILAIKNNTTMFNELDQYEILSEFQPVSGLFVEFDAFVGDAVDLTNNRLGHAVNLRPGLEYTFSEHYQTSLAFEYDSLDADGENVFIAKVADFRFNYNHDLRHSLKLSLIYQDITYNLENQPAVLPEDLPNRNRKDLFTQVIYSYKVNPQTVIFAGYSDHFKRNDQISNLRRDQHKVFLKFSYAWLN